MEIPTEYTYVYTATEEWHIKKQFFKFKSHLYWPFDFGVHEYRNNYLQYRKPRAKEQ